jgi:hypothetical protein
MGCGSGLSSPQGLYPHIWGACPSLMPMSQGPVLRQKRVAQKITHGERLWIRWAGPGCVVTGTSLQWVV